MDYSLSMSTCCVSSFVVHEAWDGQSFGGPKVSVLPLILKEVAGCSPLSVLGLPLEPVSLVEVLHLRIYAHVSSIVLNAGYFRRNLAVGQVMRSIVCSASLFSPHSTSGM